MINENGGDDDESKSEHRLNNNEVDEEDRDGNGDDGGGNVNDDDDGNSNDDDEDDDDEEEEEILCDEEPWRPAIESGNVQQLKDLIGECGLDILTQNYQYNDNDATTALLVAVQKNHVPIVQYLLEHCRSVVSIDEVDTAMATDRGHEVWTALHFAAQNGNEEMVRCLLGHGVDVNVRNFHGDGWTALFVAAEAGQEDVVQCLLNWPGCDIDGENKGWNGPVKTLLEIAVDRNSLRMVRCVMEHYQKAGNAERATKEVNDAFFWTCALENGGVEIAKYLVEAFGVDVEALHEFDKSTPLLLACKSGNLDLIQYLEWCGAKIIATNKYGNSVLHQSVKHFDVLKYFVETHGFNVDQPNHHGETVLHRAAGFYKSGECNANVNATNLYGETCLHIASRSCLPAARCVLESCRAVNVNAQDKKGQTPLHFSTRRSHVVNLFENAHFWVDTAGVNVLLPDMDGKTSLHDVVEAAAAAAAAPQRGTDQIRDRMDRIRTVLLLVSRIATTDDTDKEPVGAEDDRLGVSTSVKRQKL